jgi:hypothetical protein
MDAHRRASAQVALLVFQWIYGFVAKLVKAEAAPA